MKSIYEASVAYGREHQGTVNIEDYTTEELRAEIKRRNEPSKEAKKARTKM